MDNNQSYFGKQSDDLVNSPFMNRLGSGKSFMREMLQRSRKYNPPLALITDQLVQEGKATVVNLPSDPGEARQTIENILNHYPHK